MGPLELEIPFGDDAIDMPSEYTRQKCLEPCSRKVPSLNLLSRHRWIRKLSNAPDGAAAAQSQLMIPAVHPVVLDML